VKLPDLTIAPVVRQDSSGTTFAFTNHLSAINKTWHDRFGAATIVDWPGSAMRATGNEGVASRVKHSIGAIGYVGNEFARKLGLKIATLENSSGKFVRPDQANSLAVLSGLDLPQNLRVFVPDPTAPDAYPIVTLSWILLRNSYRDLEKGNAIRELFQWCLRDGQGYADELGYIPLPSDVKSRSMYALGTLNSLPRTQ